MEHGAVTMMDDEVLYLSDTLSLYVIEYFSTHTPTASADQLLVDTRENLQKSLSLVEK
jgi:hypothetical protein